MTKEEFLADISNWNNHRHLLWEALEATKGSPYPVLEMGCGDGSTPYIRKYCEDNNREFVSLESNAEWAAKHNAILLPDWDNARWFYKARYSVVLVDHAPGEHRREAIKMFASYPAHFQILVVHDSEPVGWNASDYQVRPLFNKFRYVYDLQSELPGGAWATWLSNNCGYSPAPK